MRLVDGMVEGDPVPAERLEQHGVYSSGNHGDLETFITRVTGRSQPKVGQLNMHSVVIGRRKRSLSLHLHLLVTSNCHS